MKNINRRSFIKKTVTAGAFAGMAGSIGTPATAATPKKGGTLRIAIDGGNSSDSLDPSKLTVEFAKLSVDGVLDTLLWVNRLGRLEGAVASEWSADDTGKVWSLKIDRRATFADGKKVTPADVIYSINLHRGEKSKSAILSVMKPIKSVKAKGNDTVVFTLVARDFEFPYILTDYHIRIVKNGETNWMKPMGTGPYVVERFEPGKITVLKRVDNDWSNRGAWADSIEIYATNDPIARTNGLLSGSFDVAVGLDYKVANLIKQSSKHSLDITEGKTHYVFPMNMKFEKYQDVNIRRAIKHAVNREKLIELVLNGYGYVGNDHPVSKNAPMFNSDIPQTQYDPDKSKYYLKKAGISKLNMIGSCSEAAFAGAVNAMTVFSEDAKKANINIKVQREPADGYWSNVWRVKGFVTSYWGGRPTALMTLTVEAQGNASWNDSYWKNSKFDNLLKSARATKDFDKRRNYVLEAQQIIATQGAVVTPMFASDINGVSNRLKGIVPHAEYAISRRKLYETVWFDD